MENLQDMHIFLDMDFFQDMEGLVKKHVEIHLKIQDMVIFQDMVTILDMEAKHDTLHQTTIGRRKKTCNT